MVVIIAGKRKTKPFKHHFIMYKGQNNSMFDAGRILSVEKLISLAARYEKAGYAFSLYVRPKSTVIVDIIISATPAEGSVAVDCPVECNGWSTVLFKSIEASATLLTDNDVYVGFGIKVQ